MDQDIRFLNSSDGSVREDQFIPFARAKIFNNRVEQRLVDIQFARNSSSRFEIVSGDVIGFANDINRDGFYEHGQNLRRQ
jgi:hypothetical protein